MPDLGTRTQNWICEYDISLFICVFLIYQSPTDAIIFNLLKKEEWVFHDSEANCDYSHVLQYLCEGDARRLMFPIAQGPEN